MITTLIAKTIAKIYLWYMTLLKLADDEIERILDEVEDKPNA